MWLQPTSTIVSGGRDYFPYCTILIKGLGFFWSFVRGVNDCEEWWVGSHLHTYVAENNKHIADLEIPQVLLWHDFSSNNITHTTTLGLSVL
jgi:hypothetical protein